MYAMRRYDKMGRRMSFPSHGGSDGPHLIHGSLDHTSQPPNGISIGSAVFAQLPPRQTDTQTTLHATSVAIGHALRQHIKFDVNI